MRQLHHRSRRRRRAGPGPWLALAVIVLVPSILLVVVRQWAAGRTTSGTGGAVPSSPGPAPAPSGVLTTPLLSWRRVPSIVARDQNVEAFRRTITDFAATLDDTSCVSVQVGGVEVASHNPSVPVMPASNQKLLTAHVALAVLGPDFRYSTEVRGPAPVGGVITGDVYLVGGGDPLLTSDGYPEGLRGEEPVTTPTSFDALVDALSAAGVSQITGDVLGDGTRYDDEYYVPSWAGDVHGLEGGPLDALIANDSALSSSDEKSDEPVGAAAEELVALLEAQGITVGGDGSTAAAPEGVQVLASVQSAPMADVVAEMLGTSDNNTAELIVKELGYHVNGQGTREAGLAVMKSTLASTGVPVEGLTLADGSGLSAENRLTCAALVGVLSQHSPDDPLGAGLPVAGQTGTMSNIFAGTPVEGRLLAKTGTLCNAPYNVPPPATKALSGYLLTDAGPVDFALVVSGTGTICDQSVYRPVWDAFVQAVDAYPSGPAATELGPR